MSTARFVANPCQCALHTLLILLCLWQTQFFIVRLWLILEAVILLLGSLRCVLSRGPAPVLAEVRLKEEGCWGAREPAGMDFIFPYSTILRI